MLFSPLLFRLLQDLTHMFARTQPLKRFEAVGASNLYAFYMIFASQVEALGFQNKPSRIYCCDEKPLNIGTEQGEEVIVPARESCLSS